MKYYLSVLVVAVAFLIGCTSTKPVIENTSGNSKGKKEPSIVGGEVSLKLYSKDKADTVESSLNYMFYETPALPYQDTVNRIVKEYVAGTVSNGGGRVRQDSDLSVAYMEEAMDIFKKSYDTEMSLYDDDGYFGGVWSTETSIEIRSNQPDYVEVSFANWNYSGGAHGNMSSEQRIIEVNSGRELFLEDFFTDVNELTRIAEQIFRTNQNIPEGLGLDEAGYWFKDGKFRLNENFMISSESIYFLYNPYEIAPYAEGSIEISIPMDKIKHLLKRKIK